MNLYSQMDMEGWKWKLHAYIVQNVLYFPNSPFIILRTTSFANQLNDDDGTGIHTFC